jgi:hypothetical protein
VAALATATKQTVDVKELDLAQLMTKFNQLAVNVARGELVSRLTTKLRRKKPMTLKSESCWL